jgi:hypothetical protein
MGVEFRADFGLFDEQIGGVGLKLGIAAFAHAQKSRSCFDNAKHSIRHASSLRLNEIAGGPVDFKWHAERLQKIQVPSPV